MRPVVFRSWFAVEVAARGERVAGFSIESRELGVMLDDSGSNA
jgi:hypothetical protein